jgi:hypothetical protein
LFGALLFHQDCYQVPQIHPVYCAIHFDMLFMMLQGCMLLVGHH